MKNCHSCKHSHFDGTKDARGRELGQCRYNPPAVVMMRVPEIAVDVSGVLQRPRDGKPVERELPAGAFPVVTADMFCRVFEGY